MDKTAIVILNRNGIFYLKKFLGFVVKYSSVPGTSVWLADNGSDDMSAEWTQKNFPTVKIIRFDKNHGFAGGYNLAIEQIEAEYFVLLNSDIEVTDGWLAHMINFMDENSDVAAVQPKILSWHNKNRFEYAGACGGFIDKFGYAFCRGRIFDCIEEDHGQYDDITEIFWTSGACMMVRSAAWKECGGLDGDFFAHMEEIDLCWRLKARGWKLFAVPCSVVYHVGGGTLPYNSPLKSYLNFRNNLFLLYKNLPKKNFRIILLCRKVLDGLSVIHFILRGRPGIIIAVAKAHRDYYRSTRMLKKKREAVIMASKTKEIRKILNRSLAFEFYIKGNRTFSSLKKYFN